MSHSRRAFLSHAAGVAALSVPALPEATTLPVPSSLGWVNVKEHGAAGDGVKDDTAAIQSVLSMASTEFRTVFFPAGTYQVRTLNITASPFMEILGDRATLRKMDASTTPILHLPDTGGAVPFSHDLRIRNLVLRGNPSVKHDGLAILNPTALITYVEDVQAYSCGGNGIRIRGANVISLNRIWVGANAGEPSLRGIFLDNTQNDVYLTDIACEGTPAEAGIEASPGGYAVYLKNYHAELRDTGAPAILVDGIQGFVGQNLSIWYGSTAPRSIRAAIVGRGAWFGKVENVFCRAIPGFATVTFDQYLIDEAEGYSIPRARIGRYVRQWDEWIRFSEVHTREGRSVSAPVALPFSTAIAADAGSADRFRVITPKGVSSTRIAAPLNPLPGASVQYDIVNGSTGRLTVQWDPVFRLCGAFTAPAPGFHRLIRFYYDGAVWREEYRSPADQPD